MLSAMAVRGLSAFSRSSQPRSVGSRPSRAAPNAARSSGPTLRMRVSKSIRGLASAAFATSNRVGRSGVAGGREAEVGAAGIGVGRGDEVVGQGHPPAVGEVRPRVGGGHALARVQEHRHRLGPLPAGLALPRRFECQEQHHQQGERPQGGEQHPPHRLHPPALEQVQGEHAGGGEYEQGRGRPPREPPAERQSGERHGGEHNAIPMVPQGLRPGLSSAGPPGLLREPRSGD